MTGRYDSPKQHGVHSIASQIAHLLEHERVRQADLSNSSCAISSSRRITENRQLDEARADEYVHPFGAHFTLREDEARRDAGSPHDWREGRVRVTDAVESSKRRSAQRASQIESDSLALERLCAALAVEAGVGATATAGSERLPSPFRQSATDRDDGIIRYGLSEQRIHEGGQSWASEVLNFYSPPRDRQVTPLQSPHVRASSGRWLEGSTQDIPSGVGVRGRLPLHPSALPAPQPAPLQRAPQPERAASTATATATAADRCQAGVQTKPEVQRGSASTQTPTPCAETGTQTPERRRSRATTDAGMKREDNASAGPRQWEVAPPALPIPSPPASFPYYCQQPLWAPAMARVVDAVPLSPPNASPPLHVHVHSAPAIESPPVRQQQSTPPPTPPYHHQHQQQQCDAAVEAKMPGLSHSSISSHQKEASRFSHDSSGLMGSLRIASADIPSRSEHFPRPAAEAAAAANPRQDGDMQWSGQNIRSSSDSSMTDWTSTFSLGANTLLADDQQDRRCRVMYVGTTSEPCEGATIGRTASHAPNGRTPGFDELFSSSARGDYLRGGGAGGDDAGIGPAGIADQLCHFAVAAASSSSSFALSPHQVRAPREAPSRASPTTVDPLKDLMVLRASSRPFA